MAQMDSWTRKVFELRVLGYQFEDIAQMYKTSPKASPQQIPQRNQETVPPAPRLKSSGRSPAPQFFFARWRLLSFHSLYKL